MVIYKTKDYADMSHKAANILAAQIVLKPNSVLGLATGSTPEGLYERLITLNKQGEIDFANITTFNLDEYIGLPPEHDQSYRYFMQTKLFDHVNVNLDNTHVPNGMETNEVLACQGYEDLIAQAGGIDLQLLGMGPNGHIGFNEPDDAFATDTHAAMLTESTIQANKRFFASEADVPRSAYTMGIRTIMRAKKIVMVVSGIGKAVIVKQAFFGPVTPHVPASILQLHPDVVLVADEEALSLCNV